SSPGQARPDAHAGGLLPMPMLDARGSGSGIPAPTRTARSSGPGLPVPSFDAPAPDAAAKPTASLDPFDASSSSGGLELAFDPDAERARAPKPTPRVSIDPRSLPPVAPPEAPPPTAPQASSGWSMPTLSFGLPGWVRGLGCFSGLSLLFFVLRMGRCAWAFSGAVVPPSPAEIEAMQAENEAAMLAGAVPLEAFLARPAAMLGRDVDRNRGFATRLRTLGATRVLVADVARVSGGELGLTLVVELPESVAARRQIATEIERYYANGMPVEAGDVAVPEPGERYEVVDLE
ncbi:MAG: hypothetical protein J0L92_33110, partial [Deltaproteobacteria bacterium]|nr:hypothetical protein [Deltaproteobacteria bacterium]